MSAAGLPKWFRVVLLGGLVILASGAGLFAYRWYSRPVTLTIAVGSLDGEANLVVSALASKLVQSNAPVRLTIVPTPGALEAAKAFAAGNVDLAVVRADAGDLRLAQAVLVVAHAAVLLIAPPGSTVTDLAELKRATIGVIGGEINQKLINALTDAYDLGRANVTFKPLAPAEARRSLETKEVRAVLLVVPLAEKYLALVRGLFAQSKGGPVLIAVESAGAIAERERAYESFDVPKGTLRGSPTVPPDDVTTLRTSFYLVAQKKLGNDVVSDLTESLMKARRDLLAEMPILAQSSEPDTGKDAYLQLHPGAAAFYDGSRLGFLDKWGNAIFLAPMIAGGLVSILAYAWKFLRAGNVSLPAEVALDALYALGPRIRASDREADLDEIEREIDRVLRAQRARGVADEETEREVTAANVAAHRLENLIHDRRISLALQQAPRP